MRKIGSMDTAVRTAAAGVLFLGAVLAAGRVEAQGRQGGAPARPEGEIQAELAQRIVNVVDEPRHRTMFVYNEDVRVLDVQINPGDRTLQHTHDTAIHYVYINLGTGPSGRIQSNTDYVQEPFTHAVSNTGTQLFQIIAMPNGSDPVADLAANRPQGLTGEPELENGWYRTYRVQIQPGQSTPTHRHYNPVLIVQTSDGRAHVTREDGITAELTKMGNWAWRNPESPYQIRNVGTTPLEVVIVEARGTR